MPNVRRKEAWPSFSAILVRSASGQNPSPLRIFRPAHHFLPRTILELVTLINLRTKIGIIAAICLLVSAGFYVVGDEAAIRVPEMQGALFKVGLVMAAIWLAYPNLKRLPGWLAVGCCVGAILIAIHRRLALLVIPLLIVAWLLRPRNRLPVKTRKAPVSPDKAGTAGK